MTYTKEQLLTMNDNEVILALAESLYGTNATECTFYGFNCYEWDCIMPMAVACAIAIEPAADGINWVAGANTRFSFTDKSPQRAIACCLLLMEGDK